MGRQLDEEVKSKKKKKKGEQSKEDIEMQYTLEENC
jgi:hypothetical protein